jgi:HD-GYP domain-containing protein (c-di-GMP phosphodiesterase class II)
LKKTRIRADQVCLGDLVPCDIYNADGKLLLKRGFRIETEHQLERLLDEGHYDPSAVGPGGFGRAPLGGRDVHDMAHAPARQPRTRVSVVARLNDAVGHLDALLASPPAPGFEAAVRAIAADVRECCALDSDAALAQILLSTSPRYSIRHQVNTAVLAAILLSRLHHDEAKSESAVAAALTMNLSIVALQDQLVTHQGPLEQTHRATMRQHPADSARALRGNGIVDTLWLQAVEQHHEAQDGTGYPGALKADLICREAQVVSLADRYCALVSTRTYRPAVAPRRAIKEMYDRAGKAIDAALIKALISAIGIFPPGAYVRLQNGETAVVVRRLLDPKHPVVFALHADTTAPYDPPRKRLTASHRDYEIVSDVKPEAVRAKVDPEYLWPPSATGEAPAAAPKSGPHPPG